MSSVGWRVVGAYPGSVGSVGLELGAGESELISPGEVGLGVPSLDGSQST